LEEGEVVVGLAVAADGNAAAGFQPGVGAFDRPAVAGQRVGRFDLAAAAAPDHAHGRVLADRITWAARFADPRRDRTVAQRLVDRGGGVAAVSPQLPRSDLTREQLVDERQQVSLLVLVASRKPDGERRSVGVYGQVVTATG